MKTCKEWADGEGIAIRQAQRYAKKMKLGTRLKGVYLTAEEWQSVRMAIKNGRRPKTI
jgi:hypothetical protein